MDVLLREDKIVQGYIISVLYKRYSIADRKQNH